MLGTNTTGAAGAIGRRALPAALTVLLAAAPFVAVRADLSRLEEVIVTAQRVARPAQSAALSVTALSAEDLHERGLAVARELSRVVPNLTWLATDGSSVGNVFIRGVGSPSIHSNQLGAVGIYTDDVTLNAPLLSSFALVDLERVEVVRGPWNAAPGRNAAGGAIRFVSRAPAVGEDAVADANLRIGTSGRFDAEIAAGFPLGERSAARIVVSRESLGDYIDNGTLGRNEGGHERTTARARWRLEMSDATEVDLNLHGSHLSGDPIRYKQIGLGTPENPGFGSCPTLIGNYDPGVGCVDQTGFADTSAFDENFSGHPDRFSANTAGASLRVEHEFGGLQLTSLTAYEGGDSQRAEDTDGGPSFIFASYQQTDSDQWSQDFELGGSRGERESTHVGMHLLGEDARYTSVRRFPNWIYTDVLSAGIPIPEDGVLTSMTYGDLEQQLRHASVWGRVDVPVASASTLTAEIRVAYEQFRGQIHTGAWSDLVPELTPTQFIGTRDVRGFAAMSTEISDGSLPESCPQPFATTRCYKLTPFDRNDVLWGGRLALDHRFSDTMLGYATVARGFKGAGISPISIEALQGRVNRPVDPETVVTYELGAKTEWRDRTLRINGTLFLNDWSDYQLYLAVQTDAGIYVVLTNMPEVRTWGGELELEWAPSAAWRATAGLGVTKGRIRDVGNVRDAQPGDRLTDVPEVTFNGLIERNWSIGRGELTLQAQAAYNGETPHADDADLTGVEPAYWLVDASAAYRFNDDLYEVTLWGRNLGATSYCVRRQGLGGVGFGNVVGCQPNEGIRFFGLSFRARIG